MAAQKIRLVYRKGERLRFLSHLDVLRAMERAIRRAGLPLAYSEGFTPHPKLAFASPLPLGFVGEAEIVDITLGERVPVGEIVQRIACKSSPDLRPLRATEVPLRAPPPQATMRWADYRVDLAAIQPEAAREVVREFLSRETFSWTEQRQGKEKHYDLRPLVALLQADPCPPGDGTRLTMRLAAGNEQNARPEQVVRALFPGAEARGYTRTGVLLEEDSPARRAWKRSGQYI